jgi:ubiquinone/menaquinone biosynthesis C-methylase UbiE
MKADPRARLRRSLHGLHGQRAFEGRATQLYDLVARRLYRRRYWRIAEDIALSAPSDGAVLDVGTGPGVLLAEIARARSDLEVTGIDPSPDMVTVAQRNVAMFDGRVKAQIGDAAHLPFPDDAFDVIVTSFSLHHWEDVPAAVPELARVSRPGARLFVYDFQRAPFDALDRAAEELGALRGPVRHTVIRTGSPLHVRTFARHVLSLHASS